MERVILRFKAKEKGISARNDRWRKRLIVLPLDQLRGLPVMDSRTTGSGVYFLWIGPLLYYIGRSVNLGLRYDEHRKKKRFTHATYLPFHREWISYMEEDYVRRYRPPNNKTSHG
jgi:hypothetical protein